MLPYFDCVYYTQLTRRALARGIDLTLNPSPQTERDFQTTVLFVPAGAHKVLPYKPSCLVPPLLFAERGQGGEVVSLPLRQGQNQRFAIRHGDGVLGVGAQRSICCYHRPVIVEHFGIWLAHDHHWF